MSEKINELQIAKNSIEAHARLQLAPIKGKDATTNIKMMVQYKRSAESWNSIHNVCAVQHHDDLRRSSDFEDTVDMRYLEETPGVDQRRSGTL
ncbi:unnamed protein product [Caenorhabditis nigoni]